jgi:glycosyltransferase involved in cell wall biosynthesis
MVLSNAWNPQDIYLPPAHVNKENQGGVRTMLRYQPISPAFAISPTVSVIIPARNEAENLPHVFSTLPSWVDEVVLVDGHSVDDTVEVARTLRPEIKVIAQANRGKGDALLLGFAAATGDIIVTIDADGSTDGAEMVSFVAALVAGADFAKGSRFSSSGASDDITSLRRYGNRLLNVLVNRMFGTQFTDLCYGYNAFWARHLDAMRVNCAGFEVEALMNIRAAKAGLKIHEIPSHERCRIYGASNLRAFRDGWRILKVIMREKFGRVGESDTAGPTAPARPAVMSSVAAQPGPVNGEEA